MPPWPATVCYLAAISALAFGYFTDQSTCIWHTITGLPCPGCGMVHAFLALARGDVRSAWNFNRGSFVAAPLAIWTVAQHTKEYFE